MAYKKTILTNRLISRYKRQGFTLECTANDCPAPRLGMSAGDPVVIRLSMGNARQYPRIYHPVCANRKHIPYDS